MSSAGRDRQGDTLYLHPLIYDLEHDAVRGDLVFYRQVCRQALPGAVLEGGAGTGRLARALCREGRDVDALEREAAMIGRGRDKAGDGGARLCWIQGDLLDYRGRERHYALALLAFNTVQHFGPDALPACLKTLRYHLALGGLLALDCFAPARAVVKPSGPWQDPVERLGPTGETWRVELRQQLEGAWLTTSYRVRCRPAGERRFGDPQELLLRRYQWSQEALTAALVQARLPVVQSYGDVDLRPLVSGSPRYLLVARRQ